jgi:large subunit ribosomal protein L32e
MSEAPTNTAVEAGANSAAEGHVAKAKPELSEAKKTALRKRSEKKIPKFRRQEWFRYKKLGGKTAPWRKPKGMHSKMRMHLKYRPNVASIGYRTPVESRDLHPSGFEEVLVYRPADLESMDPKTQAARIGGTVGGRKAADIEAAADKAGIRVLNRRN